MNYCELVGNIGTELLVGTGNLFSWSKSQILQQRPRSHRRPRNAVTQSPALNWHSTNTAPSMIDPCGIRRPKSEFMCQHFESAATDCDEAFVVFCLSTRRFLFCASDGFVITDSIEKQFVTTVLLLILIILYYSKSSMPAIIQFPFFFDAVTMQKKSPVVADRLPLASRFRILFFTCAPQSFRLLNNSGGRRGVDSFFAVVFAP